MLKGYLGSDPLGTLHEFKERFLPGMKVFESMPGLVPPPASPVLDQPPLTPRRKFTKLDIGDPFDFKHVKHVGMDVRSHDENS
jgi:P21-Rho-binding domain